MTMNDSWGYQRNDDNWKSPKTVVRNLLQCTRDTGNYLLNIGPKPDGSIPESSSEILTAVGKWMDANSALIHHADFCQVKHSEWAQFTRQGNTLYVHAYFWPGSSFGIGGLQGKLLSAKLFGSNQPIAFEQEDLRVRFTGLPASAPNSLATVLALEFDREPTQDMNNVRVHRTRESV
jgi:alpha-L-fucosidase